MNDILRMVSGAPIKHRGGRSPDSGFASLGREEGDVDRGPMLGIVLGTKDKGSGFIA
jgi:hypothetical protein